MGTDDVLSAINAVTGQEVALEALVIALLVIVLTALFLFYRRRKKGTVLLIAGPSGAGKTCLWLRLKEGGKSKSTVASLQENDAVCEIPCGRAGQLSKIRVVDVPGHASFRHKLEHFAADSVGIVFLVDAVEITPHRTEASDILFELLTNAEVIRNAVPVLIACNKADLEAQAHSIDFIKRTLEKQIDTMRKTQAASIGTTAGKDSKLGKVDKPFTFSSVKNEVTFASISALLGSLDDVQGFVRKCGL